MSFLKKAKTEGLSLKTLNSFLIVFAMLVSGYLIYSTHRLSLTFQELSAATNQYLEVHKAASEMMDAADYLTEMAQRYTLDGDSSYLHNYFEEALETRSRETAVLSLSTHTEDEEAVAQLRKALEESSWLTEREYYAMRMVAEATGLSPVPEALRDIELQPRHAQLPAHEKKEAARHMVSDEEYYRKKDRIRSDMRESLSKLEERTRSVQASSEANAKSALYWVRIVAVLQTAAILLVTWLMAQLGIAPILKAVDKLREDSPIPLTGANEFRYLARTYNKMYEAYKSSVASLNFKASHDKLTKVYNRAGYDLLMSSLDFKNASILLIDVDLFKQVNDSCGHETGDRVLQKVAATITKYFRSGDYVCRIGGDEFVTIMLGTNRAQSALMETKVKMINRDLADGSDGLPPVSVSVGVAFGDEADSPQQMFERADEALYETKRNGRNGISFCKEPQTV